jgi:hypothetical protein
MVLAGFFLDSFRASWFLAMASLLYSECASGLPSVLSESMLAKPSKNVQMMFVVKFPLKLWLKVVKEWGVCG